MTRSVNKKYSATSSLVERVIASASLSPASYKLATVGLTEIYHFRQKYTGGRAVPGGGERKVNGGGGGRGVETGCGAGAAVGGPWIMEGLGALSAKKMAAFAWLRGRLSLRA